MSGHLAAAACSSCHLHGQLGIYTCLSAPAEAIRSQADECQLFLLYALVNVHCTSQGRHDVLGMRSREEGAGRSKQDLLKIRV